MKIKRCPGCKQSKHVSEFNRCSSMKYGRQPYCRQCQRARYRETREHILAQAKEYARKNKDKIREYQREYCAQHKDERAVYHQIYYEENREQILARVKEYTHENRDRIREYHRKYRQTPAGNKIKRASDNKRKAFKRGASTAETIDRQIIIERDNAICYICGAGPLTDSEIHLDHVIPLSKGGPHTPDNLKIACCSCNLKKNNRSLAEVHECIAQGKW